MSEINFQEEYTNAQKFINKNIASFNIDYPDPKAEDYNIKFTQLLWNHVAYALAMSEVNKKLLDSYVQSTKPVQSEKDQETSHPKGQDSSTSRRPSEEEFQAGMKPLTRIRRKK